MQREMYIKGRKDGRQKVKDRGKPGGTKAEKVDFVSSSPAIFSLSILQTCAIISQRCLYFCDIESSDRQTFSSCAVQALNVIELLGSWHHCLTRLSLALSLSLLRSACRRKGGVRLPLGPHCIVCCMAMVLCFMRAVLMNSTHVCLRQTGRQTGRQTEGESGMRVCVCSSLVTLRKSL